MTQNTWPIIGNSRIHLTHPNLLLSSGQNKSNKGGTSQGDGSGNGKTGIGVQGQDKWSCSDKRNRVGQGRDNVSVGEGGKSNQ